VKTLAKAFRNGNPDQEMPSPTPFARNGTAKTCFAQAQRMILISQGRTWTVIAKQERTPLLL
jgi:hypothetical protein